MIPAAWRQWRLRELPLGVQIVALLLAGVVVAQITTLVLTMLLPPRPAPKYRMVEVARALQGGPLKMSNPRPLVRVVRSQPPSLESPNWVISDQSRADLARMVGAPPADVRILFALAAAVERRRRQPGLIHVPGKSGVFRDEDSARNPQPSHHRAIGRGSSRRQSSHWLTFRPVQAADPALAVFQAAASPGSPIASPPHRLRLRLRLRHTRLRHSPIRPHRKRRPHHSLGKPRQAPRPASSAPRNLARSAGARRSSQFRR